MSAVINSPPQTAVDTQDAEGMLRPPTEGWRSWFNAAWTICNSLTESGTTAQRPTSLLWAGRRFFDTTLGTDGQPIWRNKDNTGWVGLAAGSGSVTTINTTTPISGGPITTTGTISIDNAAADGATKGAAAFTAADFNAAAGLISIDYTNAQKATAAQPGFLTAADWTTFNGKGTGTVTSVSVAIAADDTVTQAGSPITTTGTSTLTAVDAGADKLVGWDDSASKKIYFDLGTALSISGTTLAFSGTQGHAIEDEGTPLTQRSTINFAGAGVIATDAGGKTLVTIAGGGSGTVTNIATTSPIAGGPITTTGTISIADAEADGATKGAAAFVAADFNATAGVVSIDYTNAQKATAGQPGFLTAADWTTFNNKGTGTVTSVSVAIALDDTVTQSGSPITTSGTSTLTAVDAGAADALVGWDDSAGKKVYFTLGTNLSTTGTTLNAASTTISLAAGTTPITAGTAGRVLFEGAGNVVSEDAGLTYDATTDALTTLLLTLGTVSSATGQIKLANSASANLTTLQAGNAVAARTYTWPTDFGASGTALTDAAGNGTLSWSAVQPLDADLTTIAGLTATTDNFMQSKSSAWASRTVAQVSVDLQGTGLITDAVGFRTIPQNSRSAAYTIVAADSGKHIFHPSADTTARTWTIPSNASVAFPIGTELVFVNQNAGGIITIAITTDTMRLSPGGTTGNRSLAANGIARAIKVTATDWMISGSGLT